MAMMDVETTTKGEASPCVVDLEAYALQYAGLPRWLRCKRLLFLAKASNDEQRRAALALCAKEAKLGLDTATYRAAEGTDERWVEATDDKYRELHDRLEGELASKRSCGSKDAVWEAYGNLGDALLARGEAAHALKCYVRMRDYSASAKRSLDVCCRVTVAAIEVGNWAHAANYSAKAEMIEGADPARFARLKIAAGLAHLEAKQYELAARRFVDIVSTAAPPEIPSREEDKWDVVSWRDVAGLACACALATFTRADLSAKCVDNVRFKKAVNAAHPKALEMAAASRAGDAARALAIAAELRDELRLDPLAADHAVALHDLVTDRCVAQFCAPYARVSLDKAAAKFVVFDADEFEKRVVGLIHQGKIHAKIDASTRTLVAADPDARDIAFDTLLKKSEAYVREVQALLLRMSCLEHDFVVRGAPDTPGPPPSRSAPAGMMMGPRQSLFEQATSSIRRGLGSRGAPPRRRLQPVDNDAPMEDDDDDDDVVVADDVDDDDDDDDLDNIDISTDTTRVR